ncbi:hypothetical protein C0992_001512 [Termitomyces sp. T32_za158]|nr:hypothetical protein C0992_001512 [Termitomyces sp. T32_za158]
MSRDRLAAARAQRQQPASASSHEMVSSIQESIERINSNVHQIATLHARLLNVIDESQAQDAAQLDQVAAETRTLNNGLKERIRVLERLASSGPDARMRQNRVRGL